MVDYTYSFSGMIRGLYCLIAEEYSGFPQVVKSGDVVGFNVEGREVGRVERRGEDFYYVFRRVGDESILPVLVG